jgi:hypothetical protein
MEFFSPAKYSINSDQDLTLKSSVTLSAFPSAGGKDRKRFHIAV